MITAAAIAVAVQWLGCALFCWFLADEKNRRPAVWFLLGLIFGPVALLALSGAPAFNDRYALATKRLH